MTEVNELIGEFVILVIVAIVLGLLLSYPAMLLWNSCLVPAVNGVNQVGWFQAWGIMILVGLLTAKVSSTKK